MINFLQRLTSDDHHKQTRALGLLHTMFRSATQVRAGSRPVQWAEEGTRRLAERQATWAESCNKSAAYAALNPNKLLTLDAAQV